MAFWGVPEPIEHAEQCAIDAVSEILQQLVPLNVILKQEFGFTFGIRVGMSSGVVYGGFVGCSSRLNYTVMGSVVNLAARLEPLNKSFHTQVLVNELLRANCPDHAFRSFGKVSIRGFNKTVDVYEYLGVKKSELKPEEQEKEETTGINTEQLVH